MNSFIFEGPLGSIECLVHSCLGSKAVLIMAHGFRGSREGGGRAAVLAEKLSTLVTVVRFNFNGSQILSEQVLELRAVFKQISLRFPGQQVFLLGRSLGGAAAVITSGKEHLDGLILWSTPHNLRVTFRKVLGEQQYDLLNQENMLCLDDERGKLDLSPFFLRDFDKYNLDVLLAQCACPLLILHGEADELVGVEQAKENYEVALKPKTLYIFPEADHSLASCRLEVEEIILHWLKANLSSGK